MTDLNDLTAQIREKTNAFYARAIEIHQDRELRSLAAQTDLNRIIIFGNLFYDIDGFNSKVAQRLLMPGNYREDATYLYAEKIYQVSGKKLVVNAGDFGWREMLVEFPQLTIKTIEEKIAEAIGESRWLKEKK